MGFISLPRILRGVARVWPCALAALAFGCGEEPEPNYFDPNAQQAQPAPAPALVPTPAAPAPGAPPPAPAPAVPAPAAPEPAPPVTRGTIIRRPVAGTQKQSAPAPVRREDRLGEETALKAIGPNTSSADLLVLLHDHENKYVRGTAARWLADRHITEAIDPLYAAMDDAELYVQRRAAVAYARLVPCVIYDALLQRLRAERTATRFVTIGAINELLDRCTGEAFPDISPLHDALAERIRTDDDADVREESAVLFGRLRAAGREADRQAVLLEALGDAHADVRLAAVRAFQGDTNAAAVERIVALLNDETEELWVQKAAMRTLATSGDTAGLQVVRARLTHPEPDFRVGAVQALGALGDRSALEDLVVALDDESNRVRLAAVKAVGAMAPPEAPTLLVPSLKDSNQMVRLVTCRILRELCPKDDPAVARALAAAAADRHRDVALQAVSALRCVRSTENIPELVKALCDAHSSDVRAELADLLQRTTHSRPGATCGGWRGWLKGDGASWLHGD